jgi:hypothetical protein
VNDSLSEKQSYSCVDKKYQLDVTFVFFISLLLLAQHVSGNHVPIISSWRLRDVMFVLTHPWTHYLPTGLDNLPAATAHTNTRR